MKPLPPRQNEPRGAEGTARARRFGGFSVFPYRLRLDVADVQAAGDERAQLAYVLDAAAPFFKVLKSA